MSVQFDISLNFSFVLRPDAVEQVWSLLETGIGTVSATIVCADDARRNFDSLPKLLAFRNAKDKEIRSLVLSAQSDGYKKTGRISFGRLGTPIELALTGPEDGETSRLREELLGVLKGTKAWYSPVTKFHPFYLIAAAAVFLIVFASFRTANEPAAAHQAVPASKAFVDTVMVFLWLAVGAFVAGLLRRFHARYFPKVVFALGQGSNRFQFDETIRWVVLAGLVVSVAGSLVVTFAIRSFPH